MERPVLCVFFKDILCDLAQIETVMSRLEGEPGIEEMRDALQIRSACVDHIMHCQSTIEATLGPQWRDDLQSPTLRALYNEIGERLAGIMRSDAALMQKIRSGMHDIQQRLSTIPRGAEAACGYAAQAYRFT